jgi:hypothetical protein
MTDISDETLDAVERAISLVVASCRSPHFDDTYKVTFKEQAAVLDDALARLRAERWK